VSGFTTTGSTILQDIEILPKFLLFWRSLTHWLGGLGIIVLAAAVLSILGVGAYKVMKAEMPGPEIERLTPRILHTARVLWYIYVGLTVIEVALLFFGGMSLFDALNHSFATLATGGFSTKNASIAAYSSPFIQWVITIFMVLSGVNFTHYFRLSRGHFSTILKDTELKVYLSIYLLSIIIVSYSLYTHSTFHSFSDSLRHGSFQVTTLMTSTGFATSDYTTWPMLAQGVLFLMLFFGGCVGSTSGGIKILHVTVLWKVARRHLQRLIYPRGVFPLRLNKAPLDDSFVDPISGFFFLYISTILVSTLFLTSTDSNLETSLTVSLAVLGNIGPGFAQVGPVENFAFFPNYAKIWLSGMMILGRLEIFTVLVLFFSKRNIV